MKSRYEGTKRTWQSLQGKRGEGWEKVEDGDQRIEGLRGSQSQLKTWGGALFRPILCFYSMLLGRTSYKAGLGEGLSFQMDTVFLLYAPEDGYCVSTLCSWEDYKAKCLGAC